MIKRAKELQDLERQAVKMMFDDAKNITNDGIWRNYEKKIIYKGEDLVVKAKFQCDGFFFSYKNLTIERDTRVITLDTKLN